MIDFIKKIFSARSVQKKWNLIRSYGQFVESRNFESFKVDLYQLDQLKTKGKVCYMEVWKKHGLNQIYWIEEQSEHYVLEHYRLGQ